jgi:3-deoxy-D-manno-octulosonic-acid transferase
VYWLYSALLLITLVGSAPWWLWQMLHHGKYRSGWSERLGSVPRRLRAHVGAPTIWIHAVSVGEVLAITQLVADLQAQLRDYRIVVSTTTDTGQKLARQKFGEGNVFRAPLDLPWAMRAFLDGLRPRMLVLAESEFWPNLLHSARQSGAAVAVVNARVSDRSLPRYKKFGWLFTRVLGDVDLLLAQSEEDARRLIAIGAPAQRVHVGGNLKFEVKPPARGVIHKRLADAIQRDDIGPVIVAGSTLEGEEAMLLAAFREVRERYSQAMLMLAPRHPERFDSVAALLAASGMPYIRRSDIPLIPTAGMSGAPEDPSHTRNEAMSGAPERLLLAPNDGMSGASANLAGGVLLLDSIGELASVYEFSDLAFIGGSLVPKGGHNVLEPAYFGVPILVGPYTENFRDIVDIFRRANALRVVTPERLTPVMLDLLANVEERERLGHNARDVMHSQQGATRRTAEALLRLLPDARPNAVDAAVTEHRG